MKWRDLRFQLYDRNPQLFGAFEASLDELQAIVFDFSQHQKYDLTRHALHELTSLLSSYVLTRDNSLRVPTSAMAMFFPSEITFDPVLTRQLERFKSHAARGIANSDQEFVKQLVATLSKVTMSSMKSRSYFPEHGESSVASFVLAYLNGIIQDAAVRRLDDVALEGADHLRDICAALISNKLYFSALTPIDNLDRLASFSVLNLNDVVLHVTV